MKVHRCLAALRVSSRTRLAVQTRSYATHSVHEKDVVIVGGGPVGLALASALVRSSVSVALVEAGDLSRIRDWTLPADAYSNRVSSITNASRVFLEDIGAWGYVDTTRTAPVRMMQVWDGVSDARITFDASELPLPVDEMARLTENLNLQRALVRHLTHTPNIQLFDNTKVVSIERGETWPVVQLSDGTMIRARLLVGADGFHSPVREYAGISSYGWSYDTQAIVATLNHVPRGAFQGPNDTAFQRFLPSGPIAFLPLSPSVSSLVWSTTPAIAAALCRAGTDTLACMVNAAFRLPEVSVRYLCDRILDPDADVRDEVAFREQSHGIPPYSAYASVMSAVSEGMPPNDAEAVPPLVTSIQTGSIASFPVRYQHAETYLGEGEGSRTVLVGDAAHTVHPLAGQGLNLGLGDVQCLSRCIAQAVMRGGDIGSYTALLPYARERYVANHKVMSAVDKLHKIYATKLGPVVWARSVGLEVVNELDSVKAALMMDAGGGQWNGSGWEVVAKGVEGMGGGWRAAKMIGGVISAGLAEVAKNIGRGNASRGN